MQIGLFAALKPVSFAHGALALALIGLLGCSSIQELVDSQLARPSASVQSVRLSELNSEGLEIDFLVAIDNPNALSVELAGLDYDLKLEGLTLVQGNRQEQLTIASRGISQLSVPVAFQFSDLRRLFGELSNKTQAVYDLDLGLSIDLPLLGQQRIPVRSSGNLPIPRAPKISIADVRIDRLELSGADLLLQLEIENPNPFDFALNQLQFSFDVDGSRWANSAVERTQAIRAGAGATIDLPFSVDFSEVGRSFYRSLVAGNRLNYTVDGALRVGSRVPMLEDLQVPFNKSGRLR